MKRLLFLLAISAGIALAQAPTITVSPSIAQEGQTVTATCTANCTGLTWNVNGIAGGNATVGTISGSGSTATYTAPASIVANHVVGGCPDGPNDLIWNVPLAGMPLVSNWRGDSFLNSAWFINYASSALGSISWPGGPGLNDSMHIATADNSTPMITVDGTPGGGVKLANVPWPQSPDRGRETGSYNWNHTDQHVSIVNISNCDLWEDYADNNNSPYPGCTPGSGQLCYSASSVAHQPADSGTRVGGTDAGGNMTISYDVTLKDIHDGAIKHAMHLNGPADGLDNQNNIMWPATYGTGFCSGEDVVGLIGFPTGTGYSAATTISFSGGGGAGTVWTPVISGGVITGATLTHIATTMYTSTPTVIISDTGGGTGASLTAKVDRPCMPYGARLALDAQYVSDHTLNPGTGTCPAGSNCASGAGLIVLQGLANYGAFPLDNQGNTGWLLNMADDLLQDPTVRGSITSAMSHLRITNFHVYDNSLLGKSTADGINRAGTGNAQVVPDNDAGYIPPGAAWISATNASGTSQSKALFLRAPTIGTTESEIYVLAGDYSGSKGTSGGYQLPYWVEGTASTGVTWTCSTCATNGSTITAGGIYTPPLTESTIGLQDIAICTLNSDANVQTSVYINILPNSGLYVPNTIRADVGTSSNITDGNGHSWLGNIGYRSGNLTTLNNTWQNYRGTGEQAIYNTSVWWNAGNVNYRFIVPNGDYSVRLMTGWDSGTSTQPISTIGWNHAPYVIWSNDNGYTGQEGGYGGVKGLFWNPMEHSPLPYALDSNSDFIFSDKVVDNNLVVGVGGASINSGLSPNQGFTACVNENGAGPACFPQPALSGIDIEPDATPPYWTIAATNGISPTYPTTFLTDKPVVAPGGKVGLYVQDHYTGISSPTTGITDPAWSIVSGPGSIAPATMALTPGLFYPLEQYTAPASTIGNQTVTIKAQSQSNPNVSATILLNIVGPTTGPTSQAAFFK